MGVVIWKGLKVNGLTLKGNVIEFEKKLLPLCLFW